SGKSAGLSGAIAGGAETFFGKKKGLDELLGKVTIVVAILFAASSIVLVIWK
ncbi:MAG: preprotein translocase subunit SecG, partial [Firmicutes bacterium]|nr:preprotein translocase subunit SecG [Bacillota bacterium]